MRAVVQRVAMAEVVVEGKVIASIKKGLLVLVGFIESDGEKTFAYMQDKMIHLRVFEDDGEKMNLSVNDVAGELLIVPNFTLYGDCRHGRRPSYSNASSPDLARGMFEAFSKSIALAYPKVQFGQFQASMKITSLNDGPVTLLIDSEKQF